MDFKIYLSIFLVIFSSIAAKSLAAGHCKALKNLEYKLFGTKTNYETARRHIKKTKEDDLPDSFDDDSLEEEHKELLEDKCKPVVFYFIGRHAARFPDAEEIEIYNDKLKELQHVLEEKSSRKECESIKAFRDWRPKMKPGQDNLMTDLGATHERDIAERFKQLYPEFFDVQKADIKIGVTSKLRTAQTAAEFLKKVDGLNISSCNESLLPTNDIEKDEYNLEKILDNQCYKTLMSEHNLPFLEFHKQCSKLGGDEDKQEHPLIKKVKDSELMREVADHVAKKLGLPEGSDSPITTDLVEIIFDECKYETALGKESIWCKLFEKKDIETIEYIKDLSVYIKNAYGPNAKSKQACSLIKDLVENFHEGTKLSTSPEEKRKSYFYFSHAGGMKKLLAAFDLFKDDDSYTEKRIRDLIRDKKIDDERDWQTSLVIPFSANMVFVMYKCEKPDKPVKHKILAAVTEQPVKLGHCKNTDCNSRKFFEHYDSMKDCDLNEICKKHD